MTDTLQFRVALNQVGTLTPFAWYRGLLSKALVRSRVAAIADVCVQDPSQMSPIQNQEMIQTVLSQSFPGVRHTHWHWALEKSTKNADAYSEMVSKDWVTHIPSGWAVTPARS